MDIQMPEMVEMRKAFDEFVLVADEMMARMAINATVDIKDVARIEGTSLSQIRNGRERYLLPNFGESEYPDGRIRWKVETFIAWRKIPVQDRKDAYMRMLNNRATS